MDVLKEYKPLCSRAHVTQENLDPPHLTLGSCLNRDVGASLSLLAVKKSQLEQVHSQHGCINVYLKAGG